MAMTEDDKNWIIDQISASVNALEAQLSSYIEQEIMSLREDLENQINNLENDNA